MNEEKKIESKFYLFFAMCTMLLVPSIIYGFMDNIMFFMIPACYLFNIGVSSFFILFMSTSNSKRVDLDTGAFFNYQGVSASTFVAVLPLMIITATIVGVPSIWGYGHIGIAALAILGVTGLLFREKLLSSVVNRLESKRYKMMAGFRKID